MVSKRDHRVRDGLATDWQLRDSAPWWAEACAARGTHCCVSRYPISAVTLAPTRAQDFPAYLCCFSVSMVLCPSLLPAVIPLNLQP